MNLRTKLWLGTGLLYVLVIAVVALSLRTVQRLSASGTRVLRENQLTLVYAHAIDSLLLAGHRQATPPPTLQAALRGQVARQQANITEPGERQATQTLALAVEAYLAAPTTTRAQAELAVRQALGRIERINLSASARKARRAETLGEQAMQEAVILATITALIVITLALNFPAVFISPIERLTRAVRQVGEGDFGTQVEAHDRHDELGQLSEAFNRMSQEIARYRASDLEQILATQRRTESIINRLHEPLIVADEHWRVLFFNEAARQVLGTEETKLAGRSLRDLSARNQLLAAWLQTLARPENGAEPLPVVIGGKTRYFTTEAFAIGEPATLLGYVLTMADVTRFKDLDRARADFLATVAHELKTPVSSINLSARLIATRKPGPLSDDQTQLVSGIHAEGERLLTLINALLELSRTETVAQISSIGETGHTATLQTLLEGLGHKFATLLQDKQATLELDNPLGPLPLPASQAKLETILSNLVSNAIRYVPEQGGLIRLTAAEQGGALRFGVEDNGPGIPVPEQARIFERFYKGTGGGTGLGLYIARELAAQIGAELTLDTSFTGGTRFWLGVGYLA